MKVSWKQFIKQKFRKASDFYSIGLSYTADQVLLCGLKKEGNKLIWSLDASFSHNSWQEQLTKYVQEHKLAGTPCFFALSAHWYRVHQVDKPDVEPADLFDALQWPIKEAVGADKDLTYDYSELPVQVAGQNKVLAVAFPKDEISKLSEVIYSADLELMSISVEEFATPYLVPQVDEPVITLVQEHGEVVVLNIVKNNQLYFTRRLKGFENIGGFSEVELDMGLTESLCVQIQRSMDFFESQLRQAPIRRILVKLDSPHTEYLSTRISDAMGVACESFIPNIECASHLDYKIASYSSLGAAYTGSLTMLQSSKNKKSSDDNKTKTHSTDSTQGSKESVA